MTEMRWKNEEFAEKFDVALTVANACPKRPKRLHPKHETNAVTDD